MYEKDNIYVPTAAGTVTVYCISFYYSVEGVKNQFFDICLETLQQLYQEGRN